MQNYVDIARVYKSNAVLGRKYGVKARPFSLQQFAVCAGQKNTNRRNCVLFYFSLVQTVNKNS